MPTGAQAVPDRPVGDSEPPGLPSSAALVYVGDLEGLEVEADDAHHLAHVLRLRGGEAVIASDGEGRWRNCRFVGATRRGSARSPVLEADGEIGAWARPAPPVTVGFVPTKGERPEWAAQKLTEAGVDRIVVLRSARSVVRWEGERQVRAVGRLRRVARDAAAQSLRLWLPEVVGVIGLDELDELVAPARLAMAHPGGAPPSLRAPAVAIGPEGGWEPDEHASGRPVVGLGARRLRTETAAVAAGLLLCALRQGIVAPAGPEPRPDRTEAGPPSHGTGSCNHHAE